MAYCTTPCLSQPVLPRGSWSVVPVLFNKRRACSSRSLTAIRAQFIAGLRGFSANEAFPMGSGKCSGRSLPLARRFAFSGRFSLTCVEIHGIIVQTKAAPILTSSHPDSDISHFRFVIETNNLTCEQAGAQALSPKIS